MYDLLLTKYLRVLSVENTQLPEVDKMIPKLDQIFLALLGRCYFQSFLSKSHFEMRLRYQEQNI